MEKDIIFTICAKNYLAQALSLENSVFRYNKYVDFYIYLADLSDLQDTKDLKEVINLDDSWIPNWKQMAFKYDVVEFNTSIKPYCIDDLFNRGYNKIVYMDPDTYLFNNLDYVFNNLEKFSIILTPHRCFPTLTKDPIPDDIVSNVGIYNLGFIALKNDAVGHQIINWWKAKLSSQCYVDNENGLFVDQKWMDFVPGFFPNDVLISQNIGLNVALWNFQERKIFYDKGIPMVKDRIGVNHVDKLVFCHFSGFSPLTPNQLDRRNNKITVTTNPEWKPLLKEYQEMEETNKYSYYSKLTYSFNYFSNHYFINPIIRRAFRAHENDMGKYSDPFNSNGKLYKIFDTAHLISHNNMNKEKVLRKKEIYKRQNGKVIRVMKILIRFVGIDKYLLLLKAFKKIGSVDYNGKYLIK
jgi:hypothetical protein